MKENWKKNAGIFIASQAISIFGSSLVQYAITWYITLETKSGIYATISIICGFLPMFFVSPFAGVWADRYNRKKLIIFADGGIALCTLILALLFIAGHRSVWLLFAASTVRSFGSAVQNPCTGAILPDMVPEKHLTRINGLNSSMQSLITLISPMLSGALLGFTTIEYIFFIDVITAALAIVILLFFMKIPVHKKALEHSNNDYLEDLKEGYRYIGSHKYLKTFFVFCAGLFFLAAPVAFLTPLQVARSYGGDVWRLTAIEVTFSVGMLIGGLLIAVWGGFKNRIYTVALSALVMGACTCILGLPVYFWFYCTLMGLFGLAMPFFNTPAMVLLQERVESDYLGRVISVMTMINSGVMPLGMLIFGPVADIIRIEWLLLGTGVIILLGAVMVLKNRELITAGNTSNL